MLTACSGKESSASKEAAAAEQQKLKEENEKLKAEADKLKKEKADKEASLAIKTDKSKANTTWNVTDEDALTNGNLMLAANMLLSEKKIPIAAKVAPAKVLKTPWEYYGKLVTFTGIVEVVTDYPPSEENLLTSEIVILTEDDTIVDFQCFGSSGDIQVDDEVTISGLVVGRSEVENEVGGTFTHLIVVTNKIPK